VPSALEHSPVGRRDAGRARTALVTGASRGIGRATALALADAGFDVAVAARTRRAGEGRDDSDVGHGRQMPGSLEETAEEVERRGARCLPLVADLHDFASLEAAASRLLEAWGPPDVLVNNAVDTSSGSMVSFLELTVEQLERKLRANVVAQFVLTKALLEPMLDAGGGTVVDVSSHVATGDPPNPVGQGGWGLAYAASKAAFHRLAPILAVELGGRGLHVYNLDPGYVETERQLANAAALGLEGRYPGAPPSVPASVIVWLATEPGAAALNGQTVLAQRFAREHGTHPDWRGR
jgi:NAD(P)-dependent dehydrogenase (short-subunit alcohol dehydrogenase family)